MKFDELNQLKRYYSVMEIPQTEKDKRVSLAMFFYDIFLYVLVMMETEVKLGNEINKDFYIKSLNGRIRDVLEEYPIEETKDETETEKIIYDETYLEKMTEEIVDTTMRHLDDEYYFSQDRALLIAQNESNSVFNHDDYTRAVSQGKKYKRWVTEKDERVRPAHVLVDEKIIPIDEMFEVGGELMRYPHDINGSPENTVNCRCTCVYE